MLLFDHLIYRRKIHIIEAKAIMIGRWKNSLVRSNQELTLGILVGLLIDKY